MSDTVLDSDPSPLAVTMLGGFRIRCGEEQRTSNLRTRPVDEVFAYLLLHRGHTFQRASLSATFWPDAPSSVAARQSLRSAVQAIRELVEPRPEDKGRWLVTTPATVRLNPATDWWVDVWAVEQLLET